MAKGMMNRDFNCVVRLICVIVMIVLTHATQLQGKLKPCECSKVHVATLHSAKFVTNLCCNCMGECRDPLAWL